MYLFKDKTILITGGTGSFGQFAVEKLLQTKPKEIRIYSRSEEKQQLLKTAHKNTKQIKYIIGDVRDPERLSISLKGTDIVLHAAALKHIDVCEENPTEAILTNVLGTENVIKSAIYNKVKDVINLSADKAVYPSSVYGATKLLSEVLMKDAAENSQVTRFINLRYSNVMGSSGSVLEVFKKKLENGEPIEVLNPNASRLVLTLSDVWQLLLTSLAHAKGGEIFIHLAPKLYIKELARILINQSKTGKCIVKSSLRSGEKVNAYLISQEELKRTYYVNKNQVFIHPYNQTLKKYKRFIMEAYSTNNAKSLNEGEILKLIATS